MSAPSSGRATQPEGERSPRDPDAWRLPAFLMVAASFFVQGGLVWSDFGRNPGSTAAISSMARKGQAIFRERNCQACHQIFGMGGFLGPDLTNAATRVPSVRFATLMDKGSGRMPAFHIDVRGQLEVRAYLEAVNATGQGTPTTSEGEAGSLFAAGLARWEARGNAVPAPVVLGAAVALRRACTGCHRSFSAPGMLHAPDLSLAVGRIGEEGVRRVLADGVGEMPPVGDVRDREAIVALLAFVGERRDALAPGVPPPLADTPWFAYPTPRGAGAPTAGLRRP